jgi:uncharacterized membrane protein YfcA
VRILEFALAGLATGIFSGALGVGGALLATPLIRFLGVAPYLAVGTTVPVMLPTAVTGAWTYHRAGLVDRRAALWTAASAAVAAVAGAWSTRAVDGHVLMLITALVLAIMALRLLSDRAAEETVTPRAPAPAYVALGIVAGFFSGLLGIGGGFLMVPAYIRFFRMPIKVALGTSLAVISLIVVPNLVAQHFVGNIDWVVAALLAIGVVPGARIGARLSIKARERRLRLVLVIAIFVVAVFYAFVELRALS